MKCPICGGEVAVVGGVIEDHPTSHGRRAGEFGTADQCQGGGLSPAAICTFTPIEDGDAAEPK